jgi:phosphoribosyl-AMP cyclohydrolase
MVYPTQENTMSPQLFDTWFRVGGLYRDAVQASTQQLMVSSAGIVQDQATRAVMAASQASTEALAKNAMAVQRHFLERLVEANWKAAEMMGNAFTTAWMRFPVIASTAANR